jgi:hypothetical protein
MANSKAGTAGEGNAGEAKRPAAAKKSAGRAADGAAQAAKSGGAAGARKQAAGSRGSAATTRSDSTTAAESRPAKKTTGKRAAKSPAKGGAKSAAKGSAKSARGGGKADLQGELRQFITENPEGWGHEQWQGLLGRLGERGYDTSSPDQVGMQLERERLHSRLQGVEGVSAQRARTIADRFGTLYSLRHADVDEIVRETKVSRDVAERIKSQL